MCGIVGLVSHDYVNQTIFDALTVMQHRGQDAAGMVTSDGKKFYMRKDNGLVRDAIRTLKSEWITKTVYTDSTEMRNDITDYILGRSS